MANAFFLNGRNSVEEERRKWQEFCDRNRLKNEAKILTELSANNDAAKLLEKLREIDRLFPNIKLSKILELLSN